MVSGGVCWGIRGVLDAPVSTKCLHESRVATRAGACGHLGTNFFVFLLFFPHRERIYIEYSRSEPPAPPLAGDPFFLSNHQ